MVWQLHDMAMSATAMMTQRTSEADVIIPTYLALSRARSAAGQHIDVPSACWCYFRGLHTLPQCCDTCLLSGEEEATDALI